MSRQARNPLPHLVESFFCEHLQRACGASPHTVRAYRDALRLFFIHLAEAKGGSVADLQPSDLQVEAVAGFLTHLESERRNQVATRNCRLAAIRSFFRHLLRQDPAHAEQYHRVLSLPTKKARSPLATYLEPEDVHAILGKPDRRTPVGIRHHALLVFLYNTGARVSEALAVQVQDLNLTRPPQVRLHGKGRKPRSCPLWPETAEALQAYLQQRHPAQSATEQVFLNANGLPITRFGIRYVTRKYGARALAPSSHKVVNPHSVRHTAAMHLLRAGNDINMVSFWLGHADINTTHVYVEIDMEMKRKMIATAGAPSVNSNPPWQRPDILSWLRNITKRPELCGANV